MNIASSIEYGTLYHPGRPALIVEGREISYAHVDAQASRVANALLGMGVKKGDRVAIQLPNTPLFVYAYFGILKLGAIAVSINSNFKAEEASVLLQDSGSSVWITSEALGVSPQIQRTALPRLEHVLLEEHAKTWMARDSVRNAVDLPSDAPAAILYTSGTTGVPKGAVLSHGNVVFTMEAKKRYLGIHPDDRMLLFLPLFHCFGQNAILNSALHAGASVVLQPGFDPDRVMESVARDHVTMFCGVPTTYIVLLDAASATAMKGVRFYFSAAASLPVEIAAQWQRKFGQPIYQGYGLTESSPFASYNDCPEAAPASIGTPIDGVEMRVVRVEDSRAAECGERGEIEVRGPNVMLGYWNRPDDTCEAVRNGWLRTGDIGRMDMIGRFFLEDRLKDMAIVGGCNVYPVEIENVLYSHDAVAEAAVYAVPDAVMGERLVAAIVCRAGRKVSDQTLMEHCRKRLADFKVPSEVEFTDALPKSPTGKVLKRVLRSRYAASEPSVLNARPASCARDTEDLQNRIVNWLSEKLNLDRRLIDIRRPFSDYGLTSLLAVELAHELDRWVGRLVVPTITWSFSNIHSLAAHLASPDEQSRIGLTDEHLIADIAQLSDQQAEALLLSEFAKLNA
ncbi:MAG TPA: AMP-binding protein [Bryobacteraceae bacterium]|nr:AMP-binding protein [Bryobacteraceae bacterium]